MTSIGQWELAQTYAKPESNAVVVGINVSKDHPDAAQYPSADLIQTSNDTKGLRKLLRWIGRQCAVHVVFEATGKLVKTDRADAVMLARMGSLLEPRTSEICNE